MNIVLILKNKEPRGDAYFCPINLYDVVYKFITKTIANRLKLALHNLITRG